MTTAQLVQELRRRLGNRTDIDDARLVLWLNWSMLDVCGFNQQKIFPSVWFHELEDTRMFTLTPYEGELVDVAALSVTLDAGVPATADLTGSTLQVGNDMRTIIQYTEATGVALIDSAFAGNPVAGADYMVFNRAPVFTLTGGDFLRDVWAIRKLETVRDGQQLEHVEWRDLVGLTAEAVGPPQRFARYGNKMLFDSAPLEATSYRAWVYRFPLQLLATEPTRETELPDQWDEVVVLGAVWRGFESLMEPERSAEAKSRAVEAAVNRNSSYFVEAPHVERGFKVRRS